MIYHRHRAGTRPLLMIHKREGEEKRKTVLSKTDRANTLNTDMAVEPLGGVRRAIWQTIGSNIGV